MKSSTKPFILCLLSFVLSLPSFAITATKEYVDRRDATLISKPATTVPAGYVLVKGAASNETAWVENTGAGVSPSTVTNIASSLDLAATNALDTALRSALAATAASSTNYTDSACAVINDRVTAASTANTNYTDTVASSKADLAVPATANNFAALTSSGNLADSGCSPASFAPAVEGGYLPLSAGPSYPLTGGLYINAGGLFISEDALYFKNNGTVACDIGYSYAYDGFFFESSNTSFLAPDGTDVMTEGQADFHIVSNATSVTSGQIADYDLTGLTAKTITVLFDAGMKSGDTLIWTAGNTANCEITFSITGYTQIGDTGYATATANKKCLFSIVKISANEVIISKKEY